MPLFSATYPSPLGPLVATSDDKALVSLRFAAEGALSDYPPAPQASTTPPLLATFQWLDRYFSGQTPSFLPALAPLGTPFQHRVWRELLATPYGHTVTYGELTRRMGGRSPQAVGQAAGRNPIAIIIPCHRLVAAHSLGGYAYGTATKRLLLQLEQARLPLPYGAPPHS